MLGERMNFGVCEIWLVTMMWFLTREQCNSNDSLFIDCHFRVRLNRCWLVIGLIGSHQSEADTWPGLVRKKNSG